MQTLFYILFFFTPLVLWPRTSELFEFNKMIFVYVLTTLIAVFWVVRMIKEKKIIFRRTLLDIPLLIFLGSQILATIFSIDHRTSLLGYYSRFNGGLFSTLSYLLLYFAYVSNMNKEKVIKSIYFLFYSSLVVSLIASLEHFGINITCGLMGQGLSSCWIQDVQNRVFGTLGQPNWLATWLVAIIPLTLYQILDSKGIKRILLYFLSLLLFATLLFTKSRSAFLGFFAADLIFWAFAFYFKRKSVIVPLIISNLLFVFLFLIISTPWNPAKIISQEKIQGPALETGGTESGTIRKIVWKGALKIWLNYPVFGSGPETFAFSYYKYRPVEHNLVSEWDFLYNKAHNEYLNIAATTGTLGILSYFFLVGIIFFVFLKKPDIFSASLAAGFSGILISNFFGFSTVSTQLEFFLFPALALAYKKVDEGKNKNIQVKISGGQKILISVSCFAGFLILFSTFRYWYADTEFAMGKSYNDQGGYVKGEKYLQNAIKYSGLEPSFHSELANSYAGIALSLHELKKDSDAIPFMDLSISESVKATTLSPENVNLLRNRAGVLLKLATIDPKYLGITKDTLILATQKAPTDAKLLYNLALVYMRTGEEDKSIKLVEKTIEMKPNYKEARYLYALVLVNKGNATEAKNQLNYILEKIDPKDTNSQNLLKKI
jgi:putative inorganic carbon (HCO3(-)) transporter